MRYHTLKLEVSLYDILVAKPVTQTLGICQVISRHSNKSLSVYDAVEYSPSRETPSCTLTPPYIHHATSTKPLNDSTCDTGGHSNSSDDVKESHNINSSESSTAADLSP